ncbi:MAG: FAD-binding oxidoreductase [Actinomycetota bacterium]|nr:FAD-binding oxidoreductase [Actinomycetota bacterium]
MKTMRMTGLDGEPVEIGQKALEVLADRLAGEILRPEEPGFTAAVSIWNGMISKRPAIVVQPVCANDVCEAVHFARANDVLLSVKGGGHNVAGTSLTEGGLTIDMSRMRSVAVDPRRRLARVGGGCRLGDVDRATQPYGLATVLGSNSDTGVAGLTLGGGFGYLSRRFGLAVDNLEEVEIVTADGHLRLAADDENADLFWAVRGGGGNFGVVTRFTFRLHQVGPEITGGLIVWDGDRTDEVLTLYRDITEAAPRELTVMLVFRTVPAVPFVPERFRGKPGVAMNLCHSGEPARVARDIAPIKALRPIVDMVAPRTYVDQQSILDPMQPEGLHSYWKTEFLPNLSEGAVGALRSQAADIPAPLSLAVLVHLGGAVADPAPDATAFGTRHAEHAFIAAGTWEPTDPEPDRHPAWVRSAWQAIRPHSIGNYINGQMNDEDETRVRDAYGGNLDRLAKIKAAYDPENLFRSNRNIAPGA